MRYILTGYLDNGEVWYRATMDDDYNAGLAEMDKILSTEYRLGLKKKDPSNTSVRIVIEGICECCGKVSVIKELMETL